MARRLRAALSLLVAAAVVVLSPGLEAPRLFAQVVVRAAPASSVAPVAGAASFSALAAPSAYVPSALTAAPSLASPSAFAAAPAAAAPALAAAPRAAAASLPEFARALAPNLEAAARPDVTASGAAAAGRGIEDAITGSRSAGSGDVAGAAVEGAAVSAAAPLAAASAPSEAPKPGVPAAASPAAPKSLNSAASYRVHRFLLKAVAALTGAVFTQPVAGSALTRQLIKSAAERRAVFSDYDDTLAAYNQVLPQDMVEAVQAVKAAGKDFVVISDRGDEPRAHQLTVFESLASLPVETRAGMYVAANSGGRVYRYDETGTPVRVFEAPALDEASKAKVAEAAEATKGRLKEIGAEQHFPSATNNNPSESWGTYGYAMMLKVGSSNDQVRGAADILQAELAKRGLNVEVSPRFAKDPANPPYINFSIVTKAASAAFIAKALKLTAKDVVVIGDSMYAPHEAKRGPSWLAGLGEKLSGRALAQTGNRTDANMEKALPGALALSVGATGDPRASNLWVLDGKGPALTREVLMSLASKPRAALDAKDFAGTALSAAGAAAIVAAAAASYYFIGHAMMDWLQQAEQQLHQGGRDILDGGLMLGGMLGAPRNARGGEKKGDRWARAKSAAITIGMIAATAGIYALLYWAITHAPAATSSLQIPPGYQGPIPNNVDIGAIFGGTLGLAGAAGARRAVKRAKVSDEELSAAARSVVSSKGGIWSQTEYNVGYSNALESLTKRGATKAQLERFRKLCDDAPVIGGRFNPWSGD